MTAKNKPVTLGEFIKEQLGDRSQRDLAHGAGIGMGTVTNLLRYDAEAGNQSKPTHETLQAVADYLKVPIDTLYQLAGYLPPEEDLETRMSRLIAKLITQLTPDEQQEIADLIRFMVDNRQKHRSESDTDTESVPLQKTGT